MTSETDMVFMYIGTMANATMASIAMVHTENAMLMLITKHVQLTDKRHGSDGVLLTDTHYTGGDRLLVEYKDGVLQR